MYTLLGRRKDYGYYKCRLKIFWIGAVFSFLVTLGVVLFIALTPPQSGSELQLTPTDTQLISFSYSFCDGSTLKNVQNSRYNCSMFLTIDQPPLTIGSNSFSVSYLGGLNEPTASGHYKSWYYQLNSGSTVAINACMVDGSTGSATFLLIQGASNFKKWLTSPEDNYALYTSEVNLCEGSTPNQIQQYTSASSDTYYFVFYTTTAGVQVEVDMSFDRTQYSLQGVQGLPNCTTVNSSAPCNLNVPLSTYHYVLLTFNSPDEDTIGTYYEWQWICEPRIWVYAVIVAGPAAFSFFLPLIIILACMYYWRKRDDQWYNHSEGKMPSNMVQGWIGDQPT